MNDWEKRLAERKAQGAAKLEPRKAGFWACEGTDEEKDAEVCAAVARMTAEETIAVLAYMEAATMHDACMGWATCRFTGCGKRLGALDMLTPDGKWIFPERREHYVLAHWVRPEMEFIKDALNWFKNERV